jgi:hypothetical protein
MAKKRIKKPHKPLTFEQVQRLYGLEKPSQIKLRIIWNHVQALVISVHGNTPGNLRKLKRYDLHFRTAELADTAR